MGIFEDQHDLMTLAGQFPGDDLPIGQHAEAWASVQALYGGKLVPEECGEFALSLDSSDPVESIKEAFDVIVVATGYLLAVLPPEKVQQGWNLVHESNLAKVRNGAIKREDGKFLQTPEYKKELKAKLMADLSDLLRD